MASDREALLGKEIAILPERLQVAIAVRCARRVQVLAMRFFPHSGLEDPIRYSESINQAIRVATEYAQEPHAHSESSRQAAGAVAENKSYSAIKAAAAASDSQPQLWGGRVDSAHTVPGVSVSGNVNAAPSDSAKAAGFASFCAAHTAKAAANAISRDADVSGEVVSAFFAAMSAAESEAHAAYAGVDNAYRGAAAATASEAAWTAVTADLKVAKQLAADQKHIADPGESGAFGAFWPPGS